MFVTVAAAAAATVAVVTVQYVVCVFTAHIFGWPAVAQQCVTGSLWFVFVALFCGLRALWL